MSAQPTFLPLEQIEKAILSIRGHNVMLDSDLAEVYGTTTKRLNEQVKRNRHRFPEDFMFQLSDQGVTILRSQFATSRNKESIGNYCQCLLNAVRLMLGGPRMDIDTMNVALPRSLKEYAQEQVSRGGYSSVSEYIRELIRADQKQKAKDTLEAEILKGLNSGEAMSMSPKDWQEIRNEVVKRHSSKKKNGTR